MCWTVFHKVVYLLDNMYMYWSTCDPIYIMLSNIYGDIYVGRHICIGQHCISIGQHCISIGEYVYICWAHDDIHGGTHICWTTYYICCVTVYMYWVYMLDNTLWMLSKCCPTYIRVTQHIYPIVLPNIYERVGMMYICWTTVIYVV